MSEEAQIKMDEAEENELLGEEEVDREGDVDVKGVIDETAEELMTDMKLEDEIDEVRSAEPADFNWSYHIEIYPWNADDMTESFVRLIKLAQFSQIYMRKKSVRKEIDDTEKMDDKLSGRQRKGCLHLYTDTWQNAKNIMRSSTWKTMAAKKLTFEITKRGPGSGQMESAYLELDTYSASKSRFRDKAKGELKDRSAKVSNLPGTISREFLDVVFSRAYAVIGGTTVREYLKDKEGKLQQKLQELQDFNGSIDFDCLGRGSCRAFVLAHKCVYIEGQRLAIVANDKETMIVPANTLDVSIKKKQQQPEAELTRATSSTNSQPSRGRGSWGLRAGGVSQPAREALGSYTASPGRGFIKNASVHIGRGRGMGRTMVPPQRPVTAPFSRAGPGMPIPMTGRQKMNEKLRRSNFGMTVGATGNSSGIYSMTGGLMSTRTPVIGSVGDSFKQEIASLQNELERSTQALEAKIAMLQQTTQTGAFYEGNVAAFQEGVWDDGEFDYGDGYGDEDYVFNDGGYTSQDMKSFHFETVPRGTYRRPGMGMQIGGGMGHLTSPTRGLLQGIRRRDVSDRSGRGTIPGYW